MHVLSFMNVHERMAGEHLTDMLMSFALKCHTREHGKALVCNTLLEVVIRIQVLLGGRFALLWHGNGLLGDTIDQMR